MRRILGGIGILCFWTLIVVVLLLSAREAAIWFEIPLMFYPKLEQFEMKPATNTNDCLYDEMVVEAVTPQLMAVNRQYSEFSISTLKAIDTLIAETMNVELTPTITWWLLESDTATIESKLLQYGDEWAGRALRVGWNHCQIDIFHGNVTYLTLVKTSNGDHYSFGTYFHERAHTLGALHGAMAVKFKVGYDDPTIVGPFDAYWWGEMARFAYVRGCHMLPAGTLDAVTCTKIEQIWSKN